LTPGGNSRRSDLPAQCERRRNCYLQPPPPGRLFATGIKHRHRNLTTKKRTKHVFILSPEEKRNIVTSDTIGQFSRSISGLSGDGPGDDAVPMVPMPPLDHGEAMGL
jgi:hypothetical protein